MRSSSVEGGPEAIGFEAARLRFLPILEERLMASVEGQGILFEAARYHLETGGKRLRGLLPPWIVANLGADPAIAYDLGAAFELIHNGTLVHDDVQDGDTHRRGRPTVWARFGMPQAVNVGTTLLFLGMAHVLRTARGADIIGDVNLAILDIVAGQALEFELQTHPSPTTAMWDRMSTGKTGALFSACFLASAHLAGRPTVEVARARTYGAQLGLFFQLQDDLLDLIGDKQRDVPATDIAEGKISWPVAWAAERAATRPDAVARLLAIIRLPRAETTPELIGEALGILHDVGAIAAGLGRVRALADELEGHPTNAAVPGLVERVLDPIRHAL
ncbi:MAG: polyprenyl synthetase family protein [Myxococcota bacterium]